MGFKKSLLTTFLGTSLLAPLSAVAGTPSYTFVQAGGFYRDANDFDYNPVGYFVSGSAELSDYGVFVRGEYADGEDDIMGVDVDASVWSLGLGYKYDLSDNVSSWFATASYVEADVILSDRQGRFSDDEEGYELGLGLRSNVSASVELAGAISYADFDIEEVYIFSLDAVINLVDTLGLVLTAEVDDDKNAAYSGGLRYTF